MKRSLPRWTLDDEVAVVHADDRGCVKKIATVVSVTITMARLDDGGRFSRFTGDGVGPWRSYAIRSPTGSELLRFGRPPPPPPAIRISQAALRHDAMRPRCRSECRGAPRPCPWVSCRYHLALDVSRGGRVALHWEPWVQPWRATCALDVAAEGPHTLEEVGDRMGITRERVRQIEEAALDRGEMVTLEAWDG